MVMHPMFIKIAMEHPHPFLFDFMTRQLKNTFQIFVQFI